MTRKKVDFLEIQYELSPLSPDITIVRFRGSLDAHSATKISGVFDKILDEKRYYVVADMSKLTFISSPALGMLMGCRRRVVEQDGNLVLVGVSQEMKTKLNLMGADKIFSFFSSIRSAINRFHWEYQKKGEVIDISFPSNFVYVPAIRRFVSQIALQKGYTRKDAFRVETIIDEISNNAIEHGDNNKQSKIQIRCTIDFNKIDFHVLNQTDESKVKDLKDYVARLNEKAPIYSSDRGRGLSLVRKLSQDLEVNITEFGTSVHVTKLREE